MAISSIRKILISFTDDFEADLSFVSALNAASPGQVDIRNLASGANTITLPVGGATVTGCTIIPPSTNTQSLTLKGVTGDTGIQLSKTDPTSISFGVSPAATFVLTAGGIITGLRIVWS